MKTDMRGPGTSLKKKTKTESVRREIMAKGGNWPREARATILLLSVRPSSKNGGWGMEKRTKSTGWGYRLGGEEAGKRKNFPMKRGSRSVGQEWGVTKKKK